MPKKALLTMAIIFFHFSAAHAHRPIFTDEKGIDQETAVKISEPDVSQVIYRYLSDETQLLWLAIDAKKDFELFVQIGIPVIDRLKNFRPSFVILGPGLPEDSMPFSIPENIGGKEYSTLAIKKPKFFHEHFTKTDSWILRSEKIKLPKSGRYYVVVYSPLKDTGKFWVSVGQKEKFGFWDLFRFDEWKKTIRKFHEADSKPKSEQKKHSKRQRYTRKFPRKLPGHRK